MRSLLTELSPEPLRRIGGGLSVAEDDETVAGAGGLMGELPGWSAPPFEAALLGVRLALGGAFGSFGGRFQLPLL